MPADEPDCIFCQIISGVRPHLRVYKDPNCVAFLDSRPLFPGHVLLCPREHYMTLPELPPAIATDLMLKIQLLSKAVESALDAEGTFIAINNRVSQSVPHLHVHIVPRRRKDGLKGFFWPRHKYNDDQAAEAVRKAIESAAKRF